ncbi:MAG: type II secretion system F family protein [Acidobacteriota bacterium]|nr:type II secretion system F family protein [Acidobacteriota bacterium]
MSPIAVTFVVALSLNSAILLLLLRPPASNSARQRLCIIQESVRPQNAGAYASELVDAERQTGPVRLSAFLERYGFAKRLKLLLVHANSNLSVGATCLLSGGSALVCALLTYIFLRASPWACFAGLAGSVMPYGVLRFRRSRRLKAFNASLPDAIDLMARALRAGHAMGSAIEMVADQMPEPLAFEFVQVYQQQRLGLQFRDALLQIGARVPSRDLQFLTTAILVQKETGGDLTEILDRAAHVIRERIRIEGEVRTHTAQGRLTGWILGLLPIILLVLINLVSPGYSRLLFEDPTGQKLLYAGAGLIFAGSLIIRKIVDVQV